MDIKITNTGYNVMETEECIFFGEILVRQFNKHEQIITNYYKTSQIILNKNIALKREIRDFHNELYGITELQFDGMYPTKKIVTPCNSEYKNLSNQQKAKLFNEFSQRRRQEISEAANIGLELLPNRIMKEQFINNFKNLFINNYKDKELMESALKELFNNRDKKEYKHKIILDDSNNLQIIYIVDNISDLLLYDLYMSINRKIKFSICKYCNKVYLKQGKKEFCEECLSNKNNEKFKFDKLCKDRCASLYKKIYSRLNERAGTGDPGKQDFFMNAKEGFMKEAGAWKNKLKNKPEIEQQYYDWLVQYDKDTKIKFKNK